MAVGTFGGALAANHLGSTFWWKSPHQPQVKGGRWVAVKRGLGDLCWGVRWQGGRGELHVVGGGACAV